MTREEPAFKIKNANLGLFVLHMGTADMARIKGQLEQRLRQTPNFFADTPVALGLSAIAESGVVPDFADLGAFMRARGMCPAGVLGGSPEQRAAAVQAGLGLFPEAPPRTTPRPPTSPEPVPAPAPETKEPVQPELFEPEPAPRDTGTEAAGPAEPPVPDAGATTPSPAAARPTLVVDKPVRTGQRIHAEGADLVVLATVNAGAELIADGDIHIYATLRGRALAGARGSTSARIYVQGMEAELVAVAGYFQVFEEGIPEAVRGKPAQVYLQGGRVMVEPLVRKR